jgi:hypothetical protein
VVLTTDGVPEVLATAAVGSSSARLRLDVDGFAATAWAGDLRLADVDVSALSTTRAGGFVGSWVGPVARGAGVAEFADFTMWEG